MRKVPHIQYPDPPLAIMLHGIQSYADELLESPFAIE
jgi:hypothetical protein